MRATSSAILSDYVAKRAWLSEEAADAAATGDRRARAFLRELGARVIKVERPGLGRLLGAGLHRRRHWLNKNSKVNFVHGSWIHIHIRPGPSK